MIVDAAIVVVDFSAVVPIILIKVAIAGSECGSWILKGGFDFNAFLIDIHVIIYRPVIKLDDAADHVSKFVFKYTHFKRELSSLQRKLPELADFSGNYLLFFEVSAQSNKIGVIPDRCAFNPIAFVG